MEKTRREAAKQEALTPERAKEDFGKSEKAALRRITEIIKDADAVKYVYIESLNCRIAYKQLKVEHLAMIREKSDVEASTLMLYLMLSAIDKDLTPEDIKKIPLNAAAEMISKMTKTPFSVKVQ